MKIRLKADGSFDVARLFDRFDRADKKNLSWAAGCVRKAAYRSIRIAKSPAKPGRPIHSFRGELKHAVRYKVDYERGTALVGIGTNVGNPPRKAAIAGLHEHGGKADYAPRSFSVGEWGPIRVKRPGEKSKNVITKGWLKGYVGTRLRTTAQAVKANAIAKTVRPPKTISYPKRPFMAPALNKCFPKILKKFSSL